MMKITKDGAGMSQKRKPVYKDETELTSKTDSLRKKEGVGRAKQKMERKEHDVTF